MFVNGPTLEAAGRPAATNQAVANWKRQLDTARALKMMVAYALTGHRPDGLTHFPRLTDMDTGGTPHPDGSRRQPVSRAIAASKEMAVIAEIAPGPDDYVIWKSRSNPSHQTSLELS